jgi:hypothetical protein
MNSSGKSLLLIVLSVCCVNAYISCNGPQNRNTKTRTPVVCSDSSIQRYKLDTIKGYELKPGVNLDILLNIESFNTKEEFDKFFMRPPIPVDSVPPALNFKDNWLVGILVDNRTPNTSYPHEWNEVDALLYIDSSFTKNCQLTIPFYLLVSSSSPYGKPAAKRKYVLFSVPRSAPFNEVYVMNTGGSLSRSLPVPVAEE